MTSANPSPADDFVYSSVHLYLETRVSDKGSRLWVLVHHELHPQYIMFVHME
jgi:hypothetical protein